MGNRSYRRRFCTILMKILFLPPVNHTAFAVVAVMRVPQVEQHVTPAKAVIMPVKTDSKGIPVTGLYM